VTLCRENNIRVRAWKVLGFGADQTHTSLTKAWTVLAIDLARV